MRWERFAPGPVQTVTILPSKKDHATKQPRKRGRAPRDPNLPPPKRGRPPKNRNPPVTQQASGPGEQQIFAEKSSVASVAVPPQVDAEEPEPPQPSAVATPAQAAPTRACHFCWSNWGWVWWISNQLEWSKGYVLLVCFTWALERPSWTSVLDFVH